MTKNQSSSEVHNIRFSIIMSADSISGVHPLQYGWVIYVQIQFYNDSDKKKGYRNSFIPFCKFTNVEGFWLNWNKLENVTNMFYDGEIRSIKRIDSTCPTDQPKDISSIFRLGVEPIWEDPLNTNGGELRVTLNVLMIGGSLIDCEEICGAQQTKEEDY
ncbi:uncharacterized protein [Blastocystis hominis]|uniref:Uncharacterized protein n=1 Tax=Blastocystis hominis TaxID=12968 RepID=D8M3Z5_BLAHO|nr:uncharacterized protein [Blastocystis hominis]CBK22784.2 unnamed protein product [Blastocystis hominis]|eukprot:XP_012896832.1 uncharacterized protein [Blastocystis hominis]